MTDVKKDQTPKKQDNLKDKTKKKDDKEAEEEELNEDDKLLKEKLELLVERLGDRDFAQRDNALNLLKIEISGATRSLSAVPKPLKFLSSHYKTIVKNFEEQTDASLKARYSDLASVLGMVASENEDSTDSLKYCLTGTRTDLVGWGHEYLRCLAGQIGNEYATCVEKDLPTDQIHQLVDQIIPEFINHNEEPEAVDLLLEVERLQDLTKFTSNTNFDRVCIYLLSCAPYAADPEEMLQTFRTVIEIYRKHKRFPEALRVAQKLNDVSLIAQIMSECKDKVTLKQMSFMLGRQRNPYVSDDEELQSIISNGRLHEHFKSLAKDLDVLPAKHPDEIYKQYLETNRRLYNDNIDSAKKNLALTYVNAFVNAAYGSDKLILEEKKENNDGDWIYKTKDDGQTAAAASLGLLLLWDCDEAFEQISKYMEAPERDIQAGSFMALGLSNCGVTSEHDPVQAILIDKLETCKEQSLKVGALMGLSFTYAGSARADLLEAISPIILDTGNSTQLQAVAALAIGLIYVGTCDEDAAQSILQTLMEKTEEDLENSFTRLFALGLGLLFLGQQAQAEASIMACQCIPNEKCAKFVELVVETCAYAGSGNVLKVQQMLHLCAEHKEDKESIYQVAAVIGVALIAFGEEIGTEMAMRTMQHLLQYGEPTIKRTVPLAMGLLRISNPEIQTMDLLNKLAYDSDAEVSMSAIFALGLIGAGTNNSKLAGNLRFLAQYYSGSSTENQLFVVRIAQGLVHLGKGLLGLNPMHSDKFLFSNVSLAGLLTVLYAATDIKTFIVGKYHYILYYLTLSIYPRMLITVDENLKAINTQVRVGQAVDTVGQAGKPKKITGFQTHDTPVLIQHHERAELATEEFFSETTVLENFAILRPNPNYDAEHDHIKDKKK